MNNIIYPFQIPIYQNFIDRESFNIIKEDTYKFIQKNQDLFESIWLCPTKTTQHHPLNKNIKSRVLNNQIKIYVENYYKAWDFNESCNLKISEIWVNIAKTNDYQEEHNHNSNLFSGVVYINTNEFSGDFNFINPLSAEGSLMGNPNKCGFMSSIKPQNGMILLFPSWFNHRALPNNSDEDRISISFNIKRI
tara:strand:- start:356 stop:931 length:576 start_codon:yes stop_codon:yes gene_type:complete